MITNEYLYESYLLTCMWRLLKMSRMSDTSCRVVLILQKTVITYAVPVVRESPSFFCLLLYSRFGIKVIFREVSVSIHHHRTVLHVRRRLTTLQNPDYHLDGITNRSSQISFQSLYVMTKIFVQYVNCTVVNIVWLSHFDSLPAKKTGSDVFSHIIMIRYDPTLVFTILEI